MKRWFRVCAGVGGAGLCASLWWLSGADIPTERSRTLVEFILLTAWGGFFGYWFAVTL